MRSICPAAASFYALKQKNGLRRVRYLCGCWQVKKLLITVPLRAFSPFFGENACEDLFYQMVRRLGDVGELTKHTIFIDGTKLEACANKYTFVWKKSVGKWEEKMFQKINEAVQQLNCEYIRSFAVRPEHRVEDLKNICRFLEDICAQKNIRFVHGRGKRKSKTQRYFKGIFVRKHPDWYI